MTKPTNKVAEQTDWRVDQRESRRGYQHHDTVKRWASILNFIVLYQAKHGFAPLNHTIARDTNLSVSQVQYHMGKMHEQCLIHDHGNTHPRMIDLLSGGKLLTGKKEEEEAVPAEPVNYQTLETTGNDRQPLAKHNKEDNKMGKFHTLKGDIEKMEAVAKFIDDYTSQFDDPPNGQTIANKLGISGAVVSRLTTTMVALGYIDRKKGSTKNWLTSLGRSKLLSGVGLVFDREEQDAPDVPEKPVEAQETSRAPATVSARDRSLARTGRPATTADLSDVETLDLIVELNARGYRINL